MKPSEALSAIRLLADETEEAERRASNYRFRLDRIMATIDQGHSIIDAGREAAELLGLDRDEQWEAPVPSVDPVATAAKPDDAPYGRHPDGTPKKKPGRKAKEAPAVNPSPRETEQAKAPDDEAKSVAAPRALSIDEAARVLVDQERNARELRAISAALSLGPLTVDELVLNSGVSRDNIDRHLAAHAVVEEYEGSRGPGFRDLTLVRLISQRPS